MKQTTPDSFSSTRNQEQIHFAKLIEMHFPFFIFPETLSDMWGKISWFEIKAAI